MKKRSVWLPIIAALPPLIAAVAGWIQADANAKGQDGAFEDYKEFIFDRFQRDQALEEALRECGIDEPLDVVAARFGYKEKP